MKRNLYIQMAMVAAALITAGCSGDDDAAETAPELRAISFTGGVNKEDVQTSRAEDKGLEEYSEQFIVYGYKNGVAESVMNGYTVNWLPTSAGTTKSNTHDWEYVGQSAHEDHPQVIKYWDENATNYTFFGYVPPRTNDENDARYYEVTSSAPTEQHPNTHILTFKNLYYCAEYGGFYMYASGYDADGNPMFSAPLEENALPLLSKINRIAGDNIGKPVKMEFIPPYAKIKIAFQRIASVKSSPISGITFKPSEGKIPTQADLVCTYNVEDGNTSVRLDNQETNTIFADGMRFDPLSRTDLIEGVPTVVGVLEEDGQVYYAQPSYMLFPTSGEPKDFTLQAWIGSGWQECVVPAAFMKWEMGYEYTYVFKITKAGLNLINVIKVGIKTWNSIGQKDTEFHNW